MRAARSGNRDRVEHHLAKLENEMDEALAALDD